MTAMRVSRSLKTACIIGASAETFSRSSSMVLTARLPMPMPPMFTGWKGASRSMYFLNISTLSWLFTPLAGMMSTT